MKSVVRGNSGEKFVGSGKCGCKKVEKGRKYTSALRAPYSGMKGGGEGKVVSAAGYTSF